MSSSAATTAATSEPPLDKTDTAANWAEPANVVAENTSVTTTENPAARASSPNATPKANTATASGAARRTPSA